MHFHIHKRYILFVAIVLSLIIFALCVILVRTYVDVAPERVINPDRVSNLAKNRISLGVNDVDTIASWMTFDYINHIFALPPDYLRTALGIADARYPELTLDRYAADRQMNPGTATAQVQNSVKNYFDASVTQ